ncbi:MAG TPA: hypothetical protein VFX65_15120 [Candidatus Limnocylindrales bacterium]|nr:hypothetical protein [Candidatus Limnocylindrales bacterium]
MGPLDHLRALLDGNDCTVCDAPVPFDRVRILARRDDLVFLQVDCPACGSTSLGFVAGEPARRPVRPEAERLAGGATVSSDDVLDMHDFLAGWSGDLASLLRGPVAPRTPAARRADRRTGRPA